MVDKLISIALKIEGLPDNEFIRSTAWTYINEYDQESVSKGGKSKDANGITLEVNVFKGGLDVESRGKVIESLTVISKHYAGQAAPVYVLIREIDVDDWGVLGKRITLDALFNPHLDTQPI